MPQLNNMSTPQKSVWLDGKGDRSMRDFMGGKGANLAEMTNIGLPVAAVVAIVV